MSIPAQRFFALLVLQALAFLLVRGAHVADRDAVFKWRKDVDAFRQMLKEERGS